jgi:hypothetical protein
MTALLQGLSEPVGALIALLFVKPFLTPLLLQYMLAFVGGIMVRPAEQTLSFLRLITGQVQEIFSHKEKSPSCLLTSCLSVCQ